jgi:hypothetical protein
MTIGLTPRIMRKEVDRLIDLVESGELSGTVFWSWQDVREYSRIDTEVHDGLLRTGVVTDGTNGSSQDLLVRNGHEVAQANCIHDATRIDPITTEAQPALEFNKDVAREQYRFFLWSVATTPVRIEELRCRLKAGQSALAILAITTECGP